MKTKLTTLLVLTALSANVDAGRTIEGSVVVTNDAFNPVPVTVSSPLPVTVENSGNMEVMQSSQIIVFPEGAIVHREPILTVPAGKRLVLEYISVNYSTTDSAVSTRAVIEVAEPFSVCPQDPKMRHVLNVPGKTQTSPTRFNTIVSQSIRLYAESEEHLCIHLNRTGDSIDRTVGIYLTGYYVDMF